MNPALILLELCLRTQLYSNFWCNTFLVHQMVHHKLHHSWLVVHHKLQHPLLGVHQKLHHPCYTYQDLSHYFEKNILSVLMKYYKFNAKIWHLFIFISRYILFNNCQLKFNNDIRQQWSHLKWNKYLFTVCVMKFLSRFSTLSIKSAY